MLSMHGSRQTVEINLIWLGGKKLPESQAANFKNLIMNNKPPTIINVWTDEDSRPNFENYLRENKDLRFNIKNVESLQNNETASVFECIETLFKPNRYYSAMGDYLKLLIVGRPVVAGDATFRFYTEFDDIHPDAGFVAKLSELSDIPPIMWRYSKQGAIEPDFLAINMDSAIGKLSAQYLVLFTEKICALKQASKYEHEVFVEKGADPHVIRRYAGEHLNYSVFGLKTSMEKTDEFKSGFKFGHENLLGTASKRKQEFDKEPSSWESVMVVKNKDEVLHVNSPQIRAYLHRILISPYQITIKAMENYGTEFYASLKSGSSSPGTSKMGVFAKSDDSAEAGDELVKSKNIPEPPR